MSQNIKKRILVAAIHYPIASGRYIARALRRMGYDVKTVGPYTGRDVWGMTLPEGSEWKPDIGMDYVEGDEKLASLTAHADSFSEWLPDLLITADAHFTYTGEILSIPHVVYGVDNHVRDYRHGDFDHLFLAHSNGYRIGEENITWLPCAYDPEWHTVTTPWNQRKYHAAMVGVMYQDRFLIVQGLSQHLRVIAGAGAIMEAYRDLYNQSLISICKSIKGDMAQRVFETAAMGCLILSDRVPDMEKLGMVDGVHYVGYDTPADAVSKALEIVNDWEPERVKAMIDASLEWVKPHTWDARCQVILDMVFGAE